MSEDFRNDPEDIESFRQFFQRKKIPFTEAGLIDCLHQPKTKNEAYLAILALRDLGTPTCLPVLREAALLRWHDCQSTAVLTLAQIGRENETHFLGELLHTPTFRAKYYALWALTVASDDRAVPQVLAFLDKTLKKLPEYDGLVHACLKYLLRHRAAYPEIEDSLARARDRRDRLDNEARALLETIEPTPRPA